MTYLYNIIIKIYYFGIVITGLFNKKSRLWIYGRRNLFQKIKSSVKNDNKKIAWFHCASLGEFEQGRPIIEMFKQKYPEYKIVLTFFSPSGYEIRKNYKNADYIFYLPLDTKDNATKFIELIKPKIVFFIKYEFWFNYLNILHKKNIPVFIVSAIFRPEQYFFKWYGLWFRKQLHNITHFFVQNAESKKLLNFVKINNVSVTGDTRFDRVWAIYKQKKLFPLIKLFKQDKNLFVAGSTWPKDEDLLSVLINNNIYKNLKFLIAPHEINKEHINEIINKFKVKTLKLSEATQDNINTANVLIIDSIGILSHLYQYATITYIGGGFGKGIHNILEPANFENPIIFGPNYNKFQEAKDLIKLKGAFCVTNSNKLIDKTKELLDDSNFLAQTSKISKNYIENKKGATENVFRSIKKQVKLLNG
jgi:3-deoxy-D-manno-octulosonic-acid transferase